MSRKIRVDPYQRILFYDCLVHSHKPPSSFRISDQSGPLDPRNAAECDLRERLEIRYHNIDMISSLPINY